MGQPSGRNDVAAVKCPQWVESGHKPKRPGAQGFVLIASSAANAESASPQGRKLRDVAAHVSVAL